MARFCLHVLTSQDENTFVSTLFSAFLRDCMDAKNCTLLVSQRWSFQTMVDNRQKEKASRKSVIDCSFHVCLIACLFFA